MVGASERASEPRERSAAPRPRERACWGVRGAKPLGLKKPGRCSIQLSCVLSRKTEDGRRKTEDGKSGSFNSNNVVENWPSERALRVKPDPAEPTNPENPEPGEPGEPEEPVEPLRDPDAAKRHRPRTEPRLTSDRNGEYIREARNFSPP